MGHADPGVHAGPRAALSTLHRPRRPWLVPPPPRVAELAAGLLAPCATFPTARLFDTHGAALFDGWCRHGGHAPARGEAALLLRHGLALAAQVGTGGTLVELVPDRGDATFLLCGHLAPRRLLRVDDPDDATLAEGTRRLGTMFRGMALQPLPAGAEVAPAGPAPRLVFCSGAGLDAPGAADPAARVARARQLAGRDGALLLGFARAGDPAAHEAACRGAGGFAEALARHALAVLNRELGTDADSADWDYRADHRAREGGIVMGLRARHALTLRWPTGQRRFAAGEALRTAVAPAPPAAEVEATLRAAGLATLRWWFDEATGQALVLARR